MFENLQPSAGEVILDIGSGSGWTVALLSEIVGKQGKVYGLERIKELKDFGERNVSVYGYISTGQAQIFWADGYSGLPEFAPFDKIIVAAAAEQIPPALYAQLKIGGRLMMPIGKEGEPQDLVVVDKIGENEFKETRHPGFLFVPLIKN
jgi:protein-L-isoaspartate(D-aspartate) O-methyltransferase